jgi:hypothetical protein
MKNVQKNLPFIKLYIFIFKLIYNYNKILQ